MYFRSKIVGVSGAMSPIPVSGPDMSERGDDPSLARPL